MDEKSTLRALRALEADIVKACTNHKFVHSEDKNYRACVRIGTNYFVKFDHPNALWPEFQTQLYIFEYAKSNPHPDAPRIPQVVHYFGDSMTMYLVMELITLTAAPDLIDRTAKALVWLSSVPPPNPNHMIGPLGGGPIHHKFFKEYEAPLLFSSVEALQRYIHKAHTRLPARGQKLVPLVDIRNDRIMFTQPDMHPSNFGVDQHGKTVLMNFAEIGLLPETFVAHTMFSEKRLAPVALALSLSDSSFISMATLSANLWMMADPTLGLDELGNPKTRGKAGNSERQTKGTVP